MFSQVKAHFVLCGLPFEKFEKRRGVIDAKKLLRIALALGGFGLVCHLHNRGCLDADYDLP